MVPMEMEHSTGEVTGCEKLDFGVDWGSWQRDNVLDGSMAEPILTPHPPFTKKEFGKGRKQSHLMKA